MGTISREFDITILGATGWTASMCAEHITKTFPTTLKWCIAGRSVPKLTTLQESLKALNLDRLPPSICSIADLQSDHLSLLVQRSKVIINGIGPYHRFSTPVVEACARHGTHYVDFSTETLWIADMIAAYDATARASGAVIIPAISGSSSPSDVVTWLLATAIRRHYPRESRISEVVCSGKLTMLGMQGGSLETVLQVAEKYGISWFWRGDSWVLSDREEPRAPCQPVSWTNSLFGYRFDSVLGHLATSFIAKTNESVVHRSAGLDPDCYGPDFVYHEYTPARGVLSSILIHLLTKLGILLLGLSWFKWFARRLSYQPGDGPHRGKSRRVERMDFNAVGYIGGLARPVAEASFVYKGALVDVSAIFAVEAAATLMEKTPLGSVRAGLQTPSTLGMEFVEKLRQAGVDVTVQIEPVR
ncbi:hypothetical protein JX266_011786 [Neoarthrinium moseri]|nr:hypothetical protein JX266_011786 [Neoarthrinium moseri]